MNHIIYITAGDQTTLPTRYLNIFRDMKTAEIARRSSFLNCNKLPLYPKPYTYTTIERKKGEGKYAFTMYCLLVVVNTSKATRLYRLTY